MLAAGCLVTTACLLAVGCVPGLGGGESDQSGAPQVGQCYDTPDPVLPDAHDPSPRVDCDRPHTLETYDVLQADGPLDRRTVARMGERCAQRAAEFLGGDFTQTSVSVYYFAPSRSQQEQGARWVRCDAGVITDTAVSGTRPVTGTLRDAFADGVPLEYRRCLGGPPNPAEGQPLVPCVQPHVAQQMPEGVDLAGLGRRYPGVPELTGKAQPRCAETVQQTLPGAARSLVIVPTRGMWRGGSTMAQCWALAAPGERLNDSEAQPA
jgi:hypothetical protein